MLFVFMYVFYYCSMSIELRLKACTQLKKALVFLLYYSIVSTL